MIITKAPFRISLFGGGSDLADYYTQSPAAVLSTTIDKYMYISSHRYFEDDKITAKYSVTELVTGARQLKHPIIREVLLKFGIDGVDVVILDGVVALGTEGLRALGDYRVFMNVSLEAWRARGTAFLEWKGHGPDEIATILNDRTNDEFSVIAAHAQWASAVVT